MKKLLIFCFILLLTCCDYAPQGQLNSIDTQNVQKSTMVDSDFVMNSEQFTEFCIKNEISRNVEDWDKSTWMDFETKEVAIKYLYMPNVYNVYEMVIKCEPDSVFYVNHREQHNK